MKNQRTFRIHQMKSKFMQVIYNVGRKLPLIKSVNSIIDQTTTRRKPHRIRSSTFGELCKSRPHLYKFFALAESYSISF